VNSPTATKTILLVEDNESDELLALRAFQKANVANPIAVARDGVEAIDYLVGKADRPPLELPTVVLLDLNLPRLNGLDVLQRIRKEERTRYLPVVVLTASREDVDRVRCYEAGANAYVRKPVDFREFIDVARTVGHFWPSLNESAPTH
jgi:two-component system response regulator